MDARWNERKISLQNWHGHILCLNRICVRAV